MARYSKGTQDKVEKVMGEYKRGTLRSGGSGKKVTDRKQAIAIGLSEAREKGEKVPKKAAKKTATPKRTAKKKSAAKKAAPKKAAKKSSVKKKAAKKRSTSTKKSAPKKMARKSS